jgi:phosphoribosylglycinamide formyltransferase-1
MKRICILISGRGSNMLALADAVEQKIIPDAEIALVISDHANAGGLIAAAERGIKTAVIERDASRAEHESRILAAIRESSVELVCLAGYMRLLSPDFITSFGGLILNIHPSLLPSFPGLDVQQKALEHGVKWSGCTVHLVDESLDGGPIVAQQAVPVHDDDTADTLAARILVEEHKLYAKAVAIILGGHYEIIGRRVIVKERS